MYEAFQSGGVLLWPLLAVGAGVLVLAARAAWLIGRDERAPAEAENPVQAILFWGAMSVFLGALGTVIGIVQIAQAVGPAGQVQPTLLWGGLGVALVPLIIGFLIFLVALVLWFALRQWSSRRAQRDRQPLPAA